MSLSPTITAASTVFREPCLWTAGSGSARIISRSSSRTRSQVAVPSCSSATPPDMLLLHRLIIAGRETGNKPHVRKPFTAGAGLSMILAVVRLTRNCNCLSSRDRLAGRCLKHPAQAHSDVVLEPAKDSEVKRLDEVCGVGGRSQSTIWSCSQRAVTAAPACDGQPSHTSKRGRRTLAGTHSAKCSIHISKILPTTEPKQRLRDVERHAASSGIAAQQLHQGDNHDWATQG